MDVVNLENPIPKYLQISEWLRDLIRSGQYRMGERLPSEIELSKMCGVNRNTLRQAISELVAAGMIRKEKGVGSFVESLTPMEIKHSAQRISSFKDYLGTSGIKERTFVLEKGAIQAPKKIAEAMLLGNDKKVIAVRRLRTGDDIPFVYEESYLPYNRFKDILDMDLTQSMYRIMMEKFGVALTRAQQTVRAVTLDQKIATLFNLPARSPAFFMENITYNHSNAALEVLYSYCRGDKFMLELELGQYQLKKNGDSINTGE